MASMATPSHPTSWRPSRFFISKVECRKKTCRKKLFGGSGMVSSETGSTLTRTASSPGASRRAGASRTDASPPAAKGAV